MVLPLSFVPTFHGLYSSVVLSPSVVSRAITPRRDWPCEAVGLGVRHELAPLGRASLLTRDGVDLIGLKSAKKR